MYAVARDSIVLLRNWAERNFPGCVLEFSLLEVIRDQADLDGFGIAHGGGLTLVLCNTTGIPDGQWSVQISSGLAVHIPDGISAVNWANEQNRQTPVGKYYCAIDREQGRGAAIFEIHLHATHFALLFNGSSSSEASQMLAGWIFGALQCGVTTAAQDGAALISVCGGQRFDPDDNGLAALLMCVSS